MYKIDFTRPVHAHFIGIGGISMSGLAQVLLKEGFAVSGSDSKESPLTEELRAKGADVVIGQKAENIHPAIAFVVYTAAIHPDNPEFAAAKESGIPMLTRAELLGQIMDNYENSIAVSGTHGKTTTTSMLSCIFLEAKKDPTISVGGILKEIGGNIRVGSSGNFITEACEYTNSFLSLYPKIGLILNIDADHLDFFKDLDDIRHSFHIFATNIPEDGTLVINGKIPDLPSFTKDLKCGVVTFGSDDADYVPVDFSWDEFGDATFRILKHGEDLGTFTLRIPGEHNIYNATAAVAAADLCGIPMDVCRKGLAAFGGADRRFQKKGVVNGVTIIDDYAHHPTEIRATLTAAQHYPHREIWVVFQPHTYTRTMALMDQFASALCLADHVILAEIYAAREKNTYGISSDNVREKVAALGKDAYYFPTFSEIEAFAKAAVKPGDLFITMGAGDVVKIGDTLLAEAEK